MRIDHKQFVVNTQADETFYTMIGHEDSIDENGNPIVHDGLSTKVFAKAINNRKPRELVRNDSPFGKSSYRFYIKVNPESQPFNPKKFHTVNDQNKLSFIDSKCKDGWFFKEVSQTVFDKYLLFLKTENLKWLKETQRELK